MEQERAEERMFAVLEGKSGEREILLKCEKVSVGTEHRHRFDQSTELEVGGLAGYPR